MKRLATQNNYSDAKWFDISMLTADVYDNFRLSIADEDYNDYAYIDLNVWQLVSLSESIDRAIHSELARLAKTEN